MLELIHSNQIPRPTPEEPLAQVEWLFFSRANLSNSKSGSDKYKTVRFHFIDYLNAEAGGELKKPYWVDDEFDEYVFLKFKCYIDDQAMPSKSVMTIMSAFRQVLITAIENDWIKLRSFIDFQISAGIRSTFSRAPYSEREIEAIDVALESELKFSRAVLTGYVKSGRGRAPRMVEVKGAAPRYERNWWTERDNLIWYFENVLNCVPTMWLRGSEKIDYIFLRAAQRAGGLYSFYRSLGVTVYIDQNVILPYVFRLVSITGLNPTVALSLELDSFFEQHPLTGQPCIRYWKERGSGEGELHLGLLGSGVLPLDEKQAVEVRAIWREVTELTKSFRGGLPKGSKKRLFVYECRASGGIGQPRDFLMDPKTTGNWSAGLVKNYNLTSDSGDTLVFNLSRFRPSLVSRLVKRGVDISVIQAILGHASVITTLRYLYVNDFNPVARREVQKTLFNIRENRRQHQLRPLPVANGSESIHDVIFSTGLAFCKNVFDPPQNIRKAGGIRPGMPCTYFNMCIKCPNVLIMEEHLPLLFALRRQYLVSIDQGLLATSHRAAIMQSIYILDSLLDPKVSDWGEVVLKKAEGISFLQDSLVDPVAIRPVA